MPESAKAFGLTKFVSVSIFFTTIDQLPTNSCYSLHLISQMNLSGAMASDFEKDLRKIVFSLTLAPPQN